MNLKYFFLMSALFSFVVQSQHIENSSTKITFNKKRKPFFEWVRDNKNEAFGATAIIITNTNKPPFEKKGSIKTLTKDNYQLITKGFSFYCSNIKKKNDVYYGAIIINPNQHHFDAKLAKKMCIQIRDSYIVKKLPNNVFSYDEISLESDGSDETEATDLVKQGL